MAFNFGIGTPQQQQPQPLQQQQQQQSAPLFGTPNMGGMTGFGTPAGAPAAPSLFGTPGATGGTGFTFATPVTSQPQGQTGFSLGGLGVPTTSGVGGPQLGSGFGFGGPVAQVSVAPVATSAPTIPSTITGGSSFGGLGGIPSSSTGPRLSTLALGNDPTTGWSSRLENRAVQELPVGPELIAVVEELKTQMKNHKAMMADITRSFDLDMDSVTELIEEVRMGITTLVNLMHKQELQSASLIKDMQELSKDMDLLSQAKDVPAYGYGGTSSLVHNFLYELIDKYSGRMLKYKVEIERAEFSLQTIVGAHNVNAKDLWASLTAIKDTVILLAAQIHELNEQVRNELTVHKNISQVLYATAPKPWLSNAISGSPEVDQTAPPLERVLNTPSKPAGSAPSLENVYQRTYSMLDRVPSLTDSRSLFAPTSGGASSSNVGLSASFNASLMGSYLGPSSPASSASLKRSKK